MVEHLSDDDIMRLNRGGHDPFKVYAAYHAAVNHTGAPTVILAKTVKGYGMGDAGEAENDYSSGEEAQLSKSSNTSAIASMCRSAIKSSKTFPTTEPADDSPEMVYLRSNGSRSADRSRSGWSRPKP